MDKSGERGGANRLLAQARALSTNRCGTYGERISLNLLAQVHNIHRETARAAKRFAETGVRPLTKPQGKKGTGKRGAHKYTSRSKEVARLRDEELMPFCEIAKALKMSPSTVSRAYDYAHPELIKQSLESGKSPARGHYFLFASDPELANRFFGPGGILAKKAGRLCPVLVTGSRQPLEKVLAVSLATSLRSIAARGRPPQIVEQLEHLATQDKPSGGVIVQLFEEANDYLCRFDEGAAGILLIIDELGKFLEYGASNPEQGDVFVLQELAEAAARSPRPFLFLTVLHQALDRYADHMSPGRRAEWAKVQGRFEDVAFEERTDQILRLLAHAIGHNEDGSEVKALRKQAKALSQEVVCLGIRSGSMTPAELQQHLAACYPPLRSWSL